MAFSWSLKTDKGLDEELFTLVCFPLCKPRVFSAASPPRWRAVIRCSDLKASKGEEELSLSGTVSAPGPASVQPCTFLKMKTLEWPVLTSEKPV